MIYALIYKTTNLVNKKIYIGQHYVQDQRSLDRWYIGSGVLILKAIDKYGKENFKRDIICVVTKQNHKLINRLEEYFIRKYNSNNLDIGYNILDSAVNRDCPSPMKVPEIARKSGDAHRRRYELHPELRKKQGERMKKILKRPEVKRKLSNSLIGNSNRKGQVNSKAHNEAISMSNKGRKLTEEHKRNLSKSLKGKPPTRGSKGMKLSDETRKNMSKAAKEAWRKRKVQNIK